MSDLEPSASEEPVISHLKRDQVASLPNHIQKDFAMRVFYAVLALVLATASIALGATSRPEGTFIACQPGKDFVPGILVSHGGKLCVITHDVAAALSNARRLDPILLPSAEFIREARAESRGPVVSSPLEIGYPVKASEHREIMAKCNIDAEIAISRVGGSYRYRFTTHTSCNRRGPSGFIGAAVVVFEDEAGNELGMSELIRRGVDGAWSFNASRAHDERKGDIPPETATRIARVRFVLYDDSKDFFTVLKQGGEKAAALKETFDQVKAQLDY